MEQDFHEIFGSTHITWFFAFSLVSLTKLRSLWYGVSCPLPLKLMMSDAEEGTWIHMGGYGWFMGQWVNLRQEPITRSV